MKYQSYNKEIRTATSQFMDVFNDIIIDRQDNSDVIQKSIPIPCVYGARSRILKSQENKNGTLKLPIIAINITSISRDETRVHSVNDGLFFGRNLKHNIAVPVNIEYEVTIVSKFQTDMDQIVQNFIVNFNPEIYVAWPAPHNLGQIKSQVIWSGDVKFEYPIDIDEKTPFRFTGTCTFTYKTWIFPGQNIGEVTPEGLIYKINFCDNDNYNQGLNKWYDVPYRMSMDEYLENITSGLIKYPNYDHLQVINGLDNYWCDVYGVLSGTLLNPKVSGDLTSIIENYNNPNFFLTTVLNGLERLPKGFNEFDYLTSAFYPMVSGKLQNCLPRNEKDDYVVQVVKNTQNYYNPYMHWNYYVTADDISYENTIWACMGQLSWKSDGLWEGTTRMIPTCAEYDIITSTSKMRYLSANGNWEYDIFGTSSLVFSGVTKAAKGPTGIYVNGNSNVIISAGYVYNFIIALMEQYRDYNFDLMDDNEVEVLEQTPIELYPYYYVFTNTPLTINGHDYAISGTVFRQSDMNTWTGVLSATEVVLEDTLANLTVTISHDEFFNWFVIANDGTKEYTYTKVYIYQKYENPHPNGIYVNRCTGEQMIVDINTNKYIPPFVTLKEYVWEGFVNNDIKRYFENGNIEILETWSY